MTDNRSPVIEMLSAADGKATLTLLGPALIRLTWLQKTNVHEAYARDILERSLKLVGDVPYAILVDMRQIISISAGAREAFSSETEVLAAAMLGDTPVDRVISASIEQSVHPVEFFTNEQEALRWLTEHLTDS
jgi:hypothetical protein